MNDKKILVVSNNAMQLNNANGRTLIELLAAFPKEHIAQFCLSGEPDFNFCKSCFIMSDRDAVDSILNRKSFMSKSHVKNNKIEKCAEAVEKKDFCSLKTKKNCKNMVVRDLVWRTYLWWSKEFDKFILDFSPDIIFFQAGDAPFMYYITMRISRLYHIPIVIYNSENYVLKKYLYSSVKKQNFWHFILQKKLKKAYKQIDNRTRSIIYSTEYLKNEFDKKYKAKSFVVYTSSHMPKLVPINHNGFVITYIGNLGVGREQPLIEIANMLERKLSNVKLRIFGKFPTKEIQERVCTYSSVDYKGLIPYEQVGEEMRKSDLLLHCESSDRLVNLMGAFSTKIADLLACGMPFLVYADRKYPFVQYLEKHNAAFIASNEEELYSIISECMKNKEYKNSLLTNANLLFLQNHNSKTNSDVVKSILENAVK